MNKLFAEFSTPAIAESDAYTRFQAYAAPGDQSEGLGVLDKLDEHFSKWAFGLYLKGNTFSKKNAHHYRAIAQCLSIDR